MATYQEIKTLINDSDLQDKVEVAVSIEADIFMRTATPTAAEKSWADSVLADPKSEAKKVLVSILATNNNLSVAEIQGASDSALQSQTAEIVPALVDAKAGV